ncbi:inner membrane protein VirB8 [Klebsiella pneumoniae]|uniref:Inner membrane protein VirB8 n=1 Tax=Klebsiella pneumoniae TaxID=573 RepID=A0A377V626_KLEPN|nr:inner membrane protein VirB8 [Klebsiella pneumoniae]
MGLLIAVLALVAVVVMLPLNRRTLSCIPWITTQDGWNTLPRTSKTSLTATEAYQKAMAANYVKVR